MARPYNSSYLDYFSIPLHLCFFIFILFSVLGFSWYINYESKFEDILYQLKLFLMLSPFFLLLLVHLLSPAGGFSFFLPLPEKDSLHRAGGSPWGVAFLLVFLLVMVSYQSSLHERWFPLLVK
ncbi:uncharacterized protein LOC110809592 [Carica papaya]|uniref:uncharacterized protein LOC110809592 n=1 Tax=Carica papaya TaxID=3649 RepID=UPI000B8CC7EB|nr:uncharacterized protein LOC110809592 [Carica papaya]